MTMAPTVLHFMQYYLTGDDKATLIHTHTQNSVIVVCHIVP
jgi:hypothetical protein